MPILDPGVQEYLQGLAQVPGDEVLAEMEAVAARRGFPIVGPQVGRLLAILTRLRAPRSIFELGSGYGYSTLWFARSAGPEATVHHTDGDEENSRQAREYLKQAGVVDRVQFHVGDAIDALRDVGGEHDIYYCDIDKHQYPDAFEVVRPKMRPGDLLIVDNMIWGGRVVAEEPAEDSTKGIRELTERVYGDRGLESSILPVRDGVLVSRAL